MPRSPKKKLRIWYWLTLLLAIAVAYMYADSQKLQERYVQMQQEKVDRAQQRKSVQELRQQKLLQEKRVEGLVTDPLEIEAAIRKSKRLVREGEVVYRLEELPQESTR
jgi:cell division protein FtsB